MFAEIIIADWLFSINSIYIKMQAMSLSGTLAFTKKKFGISYWIILINVDSIISIFTL